MPLNIIVGTQWGDEGKGHITDVLAARAYAVARYCGGDNAGHTVTTGSRVFRLHLIPSGIAHDRVKCVIGDGVAVNPAVLIRELDELQTLGVEVSPQRLAISRKAHLITPAHIALDAALESTRAESAIGTTKRGIGPAFTDKASRAGLRAQLLEKPQALASALAAHILEKNELLTTVYGTEPLAEGKILEQFAEYGARLAPFLADTSALVAGWLQEGRSVLAEGAQGTLLDLDHGTYPFVTSSSPTVGGALTGLGIGPRHIDRIVGVTKAFTSRVGSGPFPTELTGTLGLRLRGTGENPWDEFGTTTGRPRRVGWLDMVILQYAARVNGLTELALTKLDVLSGMDTIRVCTSYLADDRQLLEFPSDLSLLGRCRPIYEDLAGWQDDITNSRGLEELPGAARRYIDYISECLGIPVRLVSVGPRRDQVIEVGS